MKRRMVGLYFLLIISIYEGLVSGQRRPSRPNSEQPRDVRECYKDLEKDSDISHLLLDVTSPEKIDNFCGRISRLKQCIANNEHKLSNEENTKYLQKTRGISVFYLNVCPPGTDITREYKGNAPCFQLIKNKILSCGSDLPNMSSFEMQNDLSARCCALSKHRRCMLEAAGENCGRPAAEVMDQILLKYFRNELDGCPSNSHEACSREDPGSHEERHDMPEKNHHDDYDTPNDGGDYYMTTDNYDWEEDDSNTAALPMSTFLSSLLVVLLQIILTK